ncbi:MAG: glutathione S-transferase [Alphaproteobacteria bacterium]|nr:glutathione S-transferase [Alphaproteobacteria bacterium]
MRLFFTPSQSLHKVAIVAREKGLWDRITVVPVYPYRDGYDLGPINPLAKVPTLALDDGTTFYGSPVICEYFEYLVPSPRFFPSDPRERLEALRRMALADMVFEAAVTISLENGRREGRRQDVLERQWPKLLRGFAAMESECPARGSVDIGDIAALHPLSYVHAGRTAKDPLHPGYYWRTKHPFLSDWYEQMIQRPAVRGHVAWRFNGDDSPEALRRQVDAVLAARR